jgi:hypothetical protein
MFQLWKYRPGLYRQVYRFRSRGALAAIKEVIESAEADAISR